MSDVHIRIRQLKNGHGWTISQPGEWSVCAGILEVAAREALHYGMMYDCLTEVSVAIERAQARLSKREARRPA